MKVCKYCGSENSDSAVRCIRCNADAFSYKCNNCGNVFEGAFCPHCGVKKGIKAKICPVCGEHYFSNACPSCGYHPYRSAYATPQREEYDPYEQNEPAYYDDTPVLFEDEEFDNYFEEEEKPKHTERKKKKSRKGMKIFFWICVFYFVFLLFGSMAEIALLPIAGYFGLLALMFLLLAKSPKKSKYLLGKRGGIKKSVFVILCVVGGIILVGVLSPKAEKTGATQNFATESAVVATETDKASSLTDVQKWYESKMPLVSQSLMTYAQSVNGISNMNVDESRFRFGEQDGWYDCHYTLYFSCKVNGDRCVGEARAFLQYNGADPEWFHFEIFRESDGASLVEHYDASYDATIEAYYKKLSAEYGS